MEKKIIKASDPKLFRPVTFLFMITCITLLSSCVVVAGHPHRHHRRDVIVVEHR
jgi:hypothetical protein